MEDLIISTDLSKTFNAKSESVKTVLAKYNASINKIGLGQGMAVNIVRGVQEKDEAAFMKEFAALPGVRSVQKQPMPCFF